MRASAQYHGTPWVHAKLRAARQPDHRYCRDGIRHEEPHSCQSHRAHQWHSGGEDKRCCIFN